MSDKHVVAALQRSVADLELRLIEVVRERDQACDDRARAEVEGLREKASATRGWQTADEMHLTVRDLKAEVERLTALTDESEHQMHLRIRAGYDKTVADAWRAALAKMERERDEARAEVERLQDLFQRTHGVHHTWVDAADKIAKRQREACADVVRELLDEEECDCPPEWPRCGLHRAALRLRATPLVTEGEP